MGPCHAKSGMPQWARPDGGGLSPELPRADRKRVQDLFSSFGQAVEIPESKFNAFTVTYSCSHGYHALATLGANCARGRS